MRMSLLRAAGALGLGLAMLTAPLAPAGAAPLLADRPSMATGPQVLAPGILQLEIGSGFAAGALPAVQTELSQRFGLVPGWEVRMRTPFAVSGLDTRSGMELGTKAQFLEGYLLSLAGLAMLQLGPHVNPSVQGALLATLGLPHDLALTLNVGPTWASQGLDWFGALQVGYDSQELWQAYGELARVPAGQSATTAVGAGLSVLVTDDASWDVSVTRGLDAPDWTFASGFAVRWGAR